MKIEIIKSRFEKQKGEELGKPKEVLEFEFTEPTVSVYFKALNLVMRSDEGEDANIMDAGEVVLKACYNNEKNKQSLTDIMKSDPKLYVSLCMQAQKLVEVYEGDLKKN